MKTPARFDKEQLIESLRYALYVPFHPFDGFWDLTHEKRGSLAAANILTVTMIIVHIMSQTLSNFYVRGSLLHFNIIISILQYLIPLLLWTVANWSFTTLMDGKGRLHEIYMATAYSFIPNIIAIALVIPLSYVFIPLEAESILSLIGNGGRIWTAALIFTAMMMIHDYTLPKTFFSCFLTIVGMGIIVFVFVIFFSLISDGVAFFVSLYKEILFRVR